MTTAPLLAILLVTSSNLTSPNKHLLFHYPPHPTPNISLDEEIPDDSSSDTASSTSSSSSGTSTASMPSSKYSRITGDRGYALDDNEEHQDGFDRDEDDSERLWRRKPGRTTEWEQLVFSLTKRDLADILIPKDQLCNRKFELGMEDLVFLGHPVHFNETANEAGRSPELLATSPSSSINDDNDTEAILSKVKLTKFHAVFVINPSWTGEYHEQVQKMYSEIIKKFTDACVTEQNERGYISLEAFEIHKIMRDAEEKGIPVHIRMKELTVELPMSLVWEQLINTSNLASAIANLYNSIIHNKVAFIDLNNSVELAFHVKQISQISSLPELGTIPFNENNIPLLSTAHGFGEKEEEADQVLAPKYTLLLMDEPEEILKKVPTRPTIRAQNWRKIMTITPTSTYSLKQQHSNNRFKKLSRDQKLPLSLVLSMARELIDLDLARAIPPLSNRGVYIISPLAPMHIITPFSREFNLRFPHSPPLPTLLSTISTGPPKRWDTILLVYPRLSPDVLPFLMRKGWIIQLRQFYFLRIPRRIKLACIDPVSPEEKRVAEDAAEDQILVDPYRASREELKWIKKLAEEGGLTGRGRMFLRLTKYFDGKSAKEKILRREQVERSELEAMVEVFKRAGGIVVAEHW